mmetsp:Transcript_4711/g.4395  ORF Transcript_4711/g.4395 Transcript_4711/m.4395 type:complete len:98 (+) Transcript_4711:579-872(+)
MVESFFESDKVWQGDYQTKFLTKGKDLPLFDDYYSTLKHKTRVVAFIFDKSEYKDEVKYLKSAARYLSSRENLRMGIVDDVKLIKKFKLKYGVKWFS